jgi:hypothetical protein
MLVSPSELPYSEFYNILISSVVPRPIAWVSTVSATGQPNLAPFSFFNAVCADPPLLAFAPGLRRPKQPDAVHGEAKDTLRNVRETKEFVVNMVTYELAEAMNLTSGEYDASVNEFELAKLTPRPSHIVRAPRVQAASDSRLLSRAHRQQSRDRKDRLDSYRRRESQGRQVGSQLAGSHRPHGRDPIHEDDAEIRYGAAEGWVDVAGATAAPR